MRGARAQLDVTFLGSGNAFAPGRCWSGFVLNGRYLFDAPPTALLNLKQLGMGPGQLDTVFISHFHSDHFFGIAFLLLEYAWETRRSRDLTIVGPPGIEDRVEALMSIGNPGTLKRDSGYRLRYVEVEDGAEGEINDLAYRAVRVEHAKDLLQCFGYQVGLGGRRLAYTGDSAWCDGLLTLADGAEVLIADCTYPEGFNRPEHLSFDEIRELRRQIAPRTTILLTHLGGPQSDGGLDRVHVARDLALFSFP
jgi:ribonuclease BN (tRNA processing enzyme)